MRRLRCAAAIAIGIGVVACDGGISPFACIDPGPLAVTVSSDDPPVISWHPGCAVAAVGVLEGEQARWAVGPTLESLQDYEDDNFIDPPVVFGVPPEGSEEAVAAESLQPGTTYTIVLWRVAPEGASCLEQEFVLCTVARHDFTR